MNASGANRLAGALIGLALMGFTQAAAAADPFVLFLLRMLRDQAITSTIEAGIAGQRPGTPVPAPPVVAAPQAAPENRQLRGLIDESFLHLGPQQREELHASLQKMLSDPRNAAARSDIIAEFTRQATAVRDAHSQLLRLSEPDMRRLAVEARVEFARLPADQRRLLLQALQHGVPGMPRALHDLMLAEFRSVPGTP